MVAPLTGSVVSATKSPPAATATSLPPLEHAPARRTARYGTTATTRRDMRFLARQGGDRGHVARGVVHVTKCVTTHARVRCRTAASWRARRLPSVRPPPSPDRPRAQSRAARASGRGDGDAVDHGAQLRLELGPLRGGRRRGDDDLLLAAQVDDLQAVHRGLPPAEAAVELGTDHVDVPELRALQRHD